MRDTAALVRLAIGLAQGAGLSFLYCANDAHAWPAADALIFAPALFAPFMLAGNFEFVERKRWQTGGQLLEVETGCC
jgi:hypothetical protein